MDWFLFDKNLRHERVKKEWSEKPALLQRVVICVQLDWF